MPKDTDTPWDKNLSVTCDAEGLTGHAGAVLLRKLADQCGLTAALSGALARIGKFPLVDRGMVLVSMAVAIVLGATSMSDIAVLDHQEQVFGPPPSDTTVRRTLELADDRTLGKIARARAKVRAHVWALIAATPAGLGPGGGYSRRDLSNTTFRSAPQLASVVTYLSELRRRPVVQLTGKGWVLAANIAADLDAWCRLLGLYDRENLKDAEPDTLRLWSLPARLVRHARKRVLKISATWPWKEAFTTCWQRLCALPALA